MKKALKNKGFSLIELLVVVMIFMVITSVVLFNQNKFSSDISISNVAYAVALQVRQAQVYGTLVRSSTSTDSFNSGYAIHLYNTGDAVHPKGAFKLFTDDNGNFQYDDPSKNGDPNNRDTDISSFNLAEGNVIDNVCTYDSFSTGRTGKCFSSSGGNNLTMVDIVFKRPDPAAIISDDRSTGAAPNQSKRAEVDIVIKSSIGDKKRTVKVTSAGQISVIAPASGFGGTDPGYVQPTF